MFYDEREIAHLLSIEDTDASMWLDMPPKSNMHTMSNTHMRTALKMRLFLPHGSIPEDTRCICSRQDREVIVDTQGVHYTTGCNHGGERTLTHDLVVDQVKIIMKYADIVVRKEDRNAFLSLDPDDHRRPDLTAHNLPGYNRPQFFDATISSAVPPNGGILSMNDAKKNFRAGSAAFNRKMHYYNNDANTVGFGFIPLVFESSGKMHEVSKIFFKNIITQAAELRKIPFQCLWKYWISSIMFVIQRQQADSIFKRSIKCHRQQQKEEFHVFNDYDIREAEYLRQ